MSFQSVLIVDDSPTDAFIVRFMLEEAGVADKILEAANGEEALQFIEFEANDLVDPNEELPALIILDINMPRMNGFEFLEYCAERKLLTDKNTVVVMLTSSEDTRDRERADKTGLVSEYAVKPLTLEFIQALAGRVEAQRS